MQRFSGGNADMNNRGRVGMGLEQLEVALLKVGDPGQANGRLRSGVTYDNIRLDGLLFTLVLD